MASDERALSRLLRSSLITHGGTLRGLVDDPGMFAVHLSHLRIEILGRRL
jgi:hypothetical protein